MIPAEQSFTLYVGTTFGPYYFYFNATKTETIGTVTVDAETDIFTLAGHGLATNDQVRITSTGQVPYPVTNKFYFTIVLDADTFKLTDNPDSGAIDITNAGFGVHTLFKRGIPTDISGWNIWSWVKHSENDPNSAKIVDLNPTIIDGPNGIARFYLADEDTAALYDKVGDHVQSLILENTDGERLGPFIVGPFYIRRISTRP